MTKQIILLHGAIGASDQLKKLAEKFQDYDVHLFDFAGHGADNDDSDFSIQRFAGQLNAYIVTNDLHPEVFGYSMGGYVALHAALSYPSRFRSIYTYGTKFDWSVESATQETKMLNADVITEKIPKFAAALEARHSGLGWRRVLAKTSKMMLDLGANNALLPDEFKQIKTKCRLTVGTADKMVTLSETQNTSNLIPHATFDTFEDSPHPIEQVDVAELSTRIKAYHA